MCVSVSLKVMITLSGYTASHSLAQAASKFWPSVPIRQTVTERKRERDRVGRGGCVKQRAGKSNAINRIEAKSGTELTW